MSLNKANFLKTLGMASVMIIGTQSCTLYENLTGSHKGWYYNDSKDKIEKGEMYKHLLIQHEDTLWCNDYNVDEVGQEKTSVEDYKRQCINELTKKFFNNIEDCFFDYTYRKEIQKDKTRKIQFRDGGKERNTGTGINDRYFQAEVDFWEHLGFERNTGENFTVESLIMNQPIKQGGNYEFYIMTNTGEKYKAKMYKEGDVEIVIVERHKDVLTFKRIGKKEFKIQWKEGSNEGFFTNTISVPLKDVSQNSECLINLLLDINNLSIVKEKIPLDVDVETKNITKEEVKIQEARMNEIFDYGQKEIFVSNSTNFKNEDVRQSLDTLYKMLDENKSLRIMVTGYYGGKHPTLPRQRAEAVKKYLAEKGIDPKRIETVGGTESVARSIQIKIVTDEEKK